MKRRKGPGATWINEAMCSAKFFIYLLMVCSLIVAASGATLRNGTLVTFRGLYNAGGCSVPAQVSSFSTPSDDTVYVFYILDNIKTQDSVERRWINQPSGQIFPGYTTYDGSQTTDCSSDHGLSTADHPPGAWTLELWVNGQRVGATSFTITLDIRGPVPSYDGYFEPIDTDCSHLHGWARDNNNLGTTISVLVAIDGFPSVTVQAGDNRSDVGNHGWNLYNLQTYEDGKTHAVHVYYSGTTQELPGSARNFPPPNAQPSCSSPGPPSTPTVQWNNGPPDPFQVNDTFTMKWMITGGSRATYSHVHLDTNPNTVITNNRQYATPTGDQGGADGTYGQSFRPADYFGNALSPGMTIYLAVHASDNNGLDYYSQVTQSTIAQTATPPSGTTVLFDPSKATRATWLGSPQRTGISDSRGSSHSYHVYTAGSNIDATRFLISIRPEAGGSVLVIAMSSGGDPLDQMSGGLIEVLIPFGIFVNSIVPVNAHFGPQQNTRSATKEFFSCEMKQLAQLGISEFLKAVVPGGKAWFTLLDVGCLGNYGSSILQSIDQEIELNLGIQSAGDFCDVKYPIVDPRPLACLTDTSNTDAMFGDKALNTHQFRYYVWKPDASLVSLSAIEFHLNQSVDQAMSIIAQQGLTVYLNTPRGDLLVDNYR